MLISQCGSFVHRANWSVLSVGRSVGRLADQLEGWSVGLFSQLGQMVIMVNLSVRHQTQIDRLAVAVITNCQWNAPDPTKLVVALCINLQK